MVSDQGHGDGHGRRAVRQRDETEEMAARRRRRRTRKPRGKRNEQPKQTRGREKETRRKDDESGASEASDSWVLRFGFLNLSTGEKEKHRIITRRSPLACSCHTTSDSATAHCGEGLITGVPEALQLAQGLQPPVLGAWPSASARHRRILAALLRPVFEPGARWVRVQSKERPVAAGLIDKAAGSASSSIPRLGSFGDGQRGSHVRMNHRRDAVRCDALDRWEQGRDGSSCHEWLGEVMTSLWLQRLSRGNTRALRYHALADVARQFWAHQFRLIHQDDGGLLTISRPCTLVLPPRNFEILRDRRQYRRIGKPSFPKGPLVRLVSDLPRNASYGWL